MKKIRIVIVGLMVFSLLTLALFCEKADNTNLAPIDDGNWFTDYPWHYVSGNSYLNVYREFSVTHDGAPTWRMEAGTNDGADHGMINLSPSYRVIFSCWIKTTGSNPQDFKGARIGFDYYRQSGATWIRICGISSQQEATHGVGWSADESVSYTVGDNANIVKWGSDWTFKQWDFIVPAYCMSDGNGGLNNPIAGTHVIPTACSPWIALVPFLGTWQTSYFSDFQFIVNPAGTPTPTPTPPSSPTPTPSPTSSPSPFPSDHEPFVTPSASGSISSTPSTTGTLSGLGALIGVALLTGVAGTTIKKRKT